MPVETLPPVEMTLSKEEPKLVEESVPIKKYYGRKRDDQSSSEESDDYAYDTNNVIPMDTTKYVTIPLLASAAGIQFSRSLDSLLQL